MSSQRFIHNIKDVTTHETFIILGAGTGRRMRNYGSKSLLRYKSKKVIEHQTSCIRSYSKSSDIIFVTGFESDKIVKESPDCRLIENQLFETTNTVESIRLAVNASLLSNIYLIHGDIIFSRTAISIPDRTKAFIGMNSNGKINPGKVGISHQDNKLLSLSYGLTDKWSQITYIPAQYFSTLKSQVNKASKNLSTYELINILTESFDFYMFENKKNSILEIDSIKDVE